MIQIPKDSVSQISKCLIEGQVVALPTETVFGLAAALNSTKALEKLIYLKRRDLTSGKVFTLVPESVAAIKQYASLNKLAKSFIAKYIPGPITLILPKNPEFSHPYFDHFSTVGIRIPKSPLFASLLPETGPLFLTSANPRGDAPALSSSAVISTLPKVDAVVTATLSSSALPSTIVDLTGKSPLVLRQGSLKISQ
ncbi:threonylcarbamoyl-AMP synthase [Candidatus Saccharibacteria bacterium]|nr:threonylcarbamoyl-AMP synthase [Candidatus Saccharibacteria bacterium]